jgi:NitT/TauT family transport system permease protein
MLVGPIVILLLWSALAHTGLIPALFLPAPEQVIVTLYRALVSGEIWIDIWSTFFRLVIGFTLGVIAGVLLGLLMGYFESVYGALELVVDFFRSIPVMALFPLFLLFFGVGDRSKFFIAAYSSALIILINTMYGTRYSKKSRLRLVKVLRANPLQTFTKIILPDALPDIFVGFRTGLSIGLIVVVISEMFMGTHVGLGQRIYNSWLMYQIPKMYAAILLTGLMGYGFNKFFVVTERRLLHWVQTEEK